MELYVKQCEGYIFSSFNVYILKLKLFELNAYYKLICVTIKEYFNDHTAFFT